MNIFFSSSKWFLGCLALFYFSFVNETRGIEISNIEEDETAGKLRQVGQLLKELRVNTEQDLVEQSKVSPTSGENADVSLKSLLGAGHSTFTVNTETEERVSEGEDEKSSTDSDVQKHFEKQKRRMQREDKKNSSSDEEPFLSSVTGSSGKRDTILVQEMVKARNEEHNQEQQEGKKRKKRHEAAFPKLPIPTDIFIKSDDTYLKTALSRYTLRETDDSSSLYQDDPDQFMKYMDQGIFRYSCSKKVLACKILFGIAGLLVATPVTGKVLWSIGSAFNIPQDDVIANLLIGWIMTTMTPVFVRQWYERGGIIAAYLFGEERFTPDIQPDVSNRPHIIHIKASHNFHKAVSFMGDCAWAGNYAYTTWLAYHENYLALAWVFSPVIFTVFFERYWDIGAIRGTNFTHAKFSYDNEATQQKRKYLFHQNEVFLKIIAKDKKFANKIYDYIRTALGEVPDEENPQRRFYFLTSALLVKEAVMVERNPPTYKGKSSQRGVGTLERQAYHRKQKRDQLLERTASALSFANMVSTKKPSSKEAFLGYLGDLCSGAGWFGRVAGMEWLLEDMLTNIIGVEPAIASPIAWTCASLELPLLTLMEYYSLQSYMKSYVNTFSVEHLVQMTYLRKFFGGIALINGGIMGLSQMAWSLLNFRKWSLPMPLQGIAVAFPFILDQAFFSEWVKEKYDNILTGACTLRPHTNITVEEKKAWLLYWSSEMRKYLYTWDEETINILYDRIVNAPKADEADI